MSPVQDLHHTTNKPCTRCIAKTRQGTHCHNLASCHAHSDLLCIVHYRQQFGSDSDDDDDLDDDEPVVLVPLSQRCEQCTALRNDGERCHNLAACHARSGKYCRVHAKKIRKIRPVELFPVSRGTQYTAEERAQTGFDSLDDRLNKIEQSTAKLNKTLDKLKRR